ncbi:cutinase family protein [Cumulibacter soli]|uniref:cutinase family protein n=1 Tax=Cumulibacter soli TaxID=2546344 RepID=UPI0014195274|nr:cutinase family protein [Cumulibacter soli]
MQSSPDLLIVTVRGSTEPQSGSRLLIPIARTVMRQYPGSSRVRELTYPASFVSFSTEHPARLDLGISPHIGVRNLIAELNEESRHSPRQQYVLLGWSQGAQVITDALVPADQRIAGQQAGALDAPIGGRIRAIALFGNPAFTAGEPFNAGTFAPTIDGITPRRRGALAEYQSRLRDYCAAGDVAAQDAPGSTVDGHVSYFHNGMPADAARFILDRLMQPTGRQRSLSR